MADLTDKTALVTGASSGIGKSTVEMLLNAGVRVYAAARRLEKMKDLEENGALTVKMDITDKDSMKEIIDRILNREGSIDILINNAGYGSYGANEDVPIDEGRRQWEVNIFGPASLIQMVLPGMRENRYGKIINISSIGGKIYTPFGGWYHATKHALEGLTDCLRLEVAPFGIDAVIIEPGGIATDWGVIAADNLKKTSGGGAYAERAGRRPETRIRKKKEKKPSFQRPSNCLGEAVFKRLSIINSSSGFYRTLPEQNDIPFQ